MMSKPVIEVGRTLVEAELARPSGALVEPAGFLPDRARPAARKKIRKPGLSRAESCFVHSKLLPLLVLVLALSASGCGSAMSQGMTAFEDGRYPEAVAHFRQVEAEARDWPQERRARYALYRGLTHLSCGDVRAADRWLSQAKRFWENDPSVLDAAEHGRLLAAWRSMGRMPGELPTR
jgi:uncharacterized protein YceK